MSSAAIARETATKLVSRLEVTTGSKMLAYEQVASRAKRSIRWVIALIREGRGVVTADIRGAFDAFMMEQLKAEFGRLTHDLEVARQRGEHPAGEHMGEIEAHLAKIKTLMNGRGE